MTDAPKRVLEALNAKDIDAFVSCYTAEATIEDGHDVVRTRGHKELRAQYGAAFDAYPDLRVEPLSRVDVGDFVVQHERVTGRGEPEQHVAVYLLRDGLIARERLLR